MLPSITSECRVVADPELRFAPSGTAICKIRTVSSKRKKDESGEWVDDKTTWLNVTAFGKLGENCAESLEKGDLIVVTGRLEQDDYEKDGEKRTSFGIVADTVSLSLMFRTVPRGAGKAVRGSSERAAATAAKEDDPWAALPATAAALDEPPF